MRSLIILFFASVLLVLSCSEDTHITPIENGNTVAMRDKGSDPCDPPVSYYYHEIIPVDSCTILLANGLFGHVEFRLLKDYEAINTGILPNCRETDYTYQLIAEYRYFDANDSPFSGIATTHVFANLDRFSTTFGNATVNDCFEETLADPCLPTHIRRHVIDQASTTLLYWDPTAVFDIGIEGVVFDGGYLLAPNCPDSCFHLDENPCEVSSNCVVYTACPLSVDEVSGTD